MPEKLRQEIAEDLEGVLTPQTARDGVYQGPASLTEQPVTATYEISRLDRRLNAYTLQVGYEDFGDQDLTLPIYGGLPNPDGWDAWLLKPDGQAGTNATEFLPEFFPVLKSIWPKSNVDEDLDAYREWALRPLAVEYYLNNTTGSDGNFSLRIKSGTQEKNNWTVRDEILGSNTTGFGRTERIPRDTVQSNLYIPKWIGGRQQYWLKFSVSGVDLGDQQNLTFWFDLMRWPGPVGS